MRRGIQPSPRLASPLVLAWPPAPRAWAIPLADRERGRVSARTGHPSHRRPPLPARRAEPLRCPAGSSSLADPSSGGRPGTRERLRDDRALRPSARTRRAAARATRSPQRRTPPPGCPRDGVGWGYLVVGATGFEPATPSTPSWCASRLRYAPTWAPLIRCPGPAPHRSRAHDPRGRSGRPRRTIRWRDDRGEPERRRRWAQRAATTE